MSEGELYVERLPRKTRFYDRSKLWSYEMARLVAIKIIDEPLRIEDGRAFLEQHVKPDPHQSAYYVMWTEMLRKDSKEIARQILEDSPEGELFRDTMPVFYVPTPDERGAALQRARVRAHGERLEVAPA